MPPRGTAPADGNQRPAFVESTEPYQRELRLYCYRMCGSAADADDLLQETMLRAWRAWPGFRAESTVRTWLYRIATNVCIAHLRRRDRRWPEPMPDRFLDTAMADGGPAEQSVRRETIELTFLAALQVLSTRQRAALILRDVLGLPAREAASVLGITVTAVKSALQRARTAMRDALAADRSMWPADRPATAAQREVARRYVAALEERDAAAMAALLHADLKAAYLPRELYVAGRQAFIEGIERYAPAGEFRYVETGANMQPAIAVYLRAPGAPAYHLLSVAVLRVAGGQIVEIADFSDPRVVRTFGLPAELASH